MPDPQRLFGRITASNLPRRLVSHLAVVSLVGVASLAGLAQAHTGGPDAGGNTGFLIPTVRGADDSAPRPHPSSLLGPATAADPAGAPFPGEAANLVDRGASATIPTADEPMPTPVPLDPDATPIPAPANGVGQTETAGSGSGGPTTRAAAAPPPTTGMAWPVPGGSVSQYFHAGHLALDIAAPYGNQVVAAQSGVVSWAGWRNNGGGFVVAIDHGNGMRSSYNHLGTVWVSPGQFVVAGQAIGPVGCSGICTGPHVHFEIVTNGVIDNPMRYY